MSAKSDAKAIKPLSAEEVLRAIEGYLATDRIADAYRLSGAVLARKLEHPLPHIAQAEWLSRNDELEKAAIELVRARSLTQEPTLLARIGDFQMRLEMPMEADTTYSQALWIDPVSLDLLYRKGWATAGTGDHVAAEKIYREILQEDPNHPAANASVASILARLGRFDEATAFANRALSADPTRATATIALATIAISRKDFAAAEKLLTPLLETALTASNKSSLLAMLGDVADGQRQYSNAFHFYKQKNDLQLSESPAGARNKAIDAVRNLTRYFQNADRTVWQAAYSGPVEQSYPSSHVFLMGFMRSGTTLLEQVLASSSDVVALEEKGLLNEPAEFFMTSDFGLNALAATQEFELVNLRKKYWTCVSAQGVDVAGKIFIDKQPFNTSKLPLIAKLFPDAKIVFAIRDPRDVVFSCFRRHFARNETVREFLRLSDCANFYAAYMELAHIYFEFFPSSRYNHRYEFMIDNFEKSVKDVCKFIGTPWRENMREFNANKSFDIRSPSAAQVQQPLYKDGMAHWRRYEDQLKPIVRTLEPWVKRFGYT